MDTQDFVHGIDFTGLGTQTAAEHNQLIDQAIPENDGADDIGKSLNLVTKDSAIGVPSVPDAGTNTKWKRYQWCRKPNNADTNRIMRIYIWDDTIASDPTYLKWLQVQTDISSLSTSVATALANAATALTTANSAAATANSANTTALSASSSVANATNSAANALTVANAAQTTATSALTTAGTANANATAALSASGAAVTLPKLPVGGNAGQIYRSKNDNTAMEMIVVQNEYVKCSYITNKGTNAAAVAIGQNIIPFNNKDFDLGGIATLAGSKITLPPGVYKVSYKGVGQGGAAGFQAFLVNDSTNAILIEGISTLVSVNASIQYSIDGLLIINVSNGNMTVRVDLYSISNQNPRAYATNKNPASVNPHEVYDVIEFQRIGYIP